MGWVRRASEAIPKETSGGFPGPASADLDGDRFVSTDELVAYADETSAPARPDVPPDGPPGG